MHKCIRGVPRDLVFSCTNNTRRIHRSNMEILLVSSEFNNRKGHHKSLPLDSGKGIPPKHAMLVHGTFQGCVESSRVFRVEY